MLRAESGGGYQPKAWRAIEGTLGEILTANERRLVEIYRETAGDEEIAVDLSVEMALHDALRTGREKSSRRGDSVERTATLIRTRDAAL